MKRSVLIGGVIFSSPAVLIYALYTGGFDVTTNDSQVDAANAGAPLASIAKGRERPSEFSTPGAYRDLDISLGAAAPAPHKAVPTYSFPYSHTPPGLAVLTADEHNELFAQKKEALEAEISQIGEMILSLELSGASDDEVAHFRNLKKDLEGEVVLSDSMVDTDAVAHTEEGLYEDFIASLEKSGLPAAEIDQMIEHYDSGDQTIEEIEGYHVDGPVGPAGPAPLPHEN
jgi:hypothetical protein